MNRYITLQNTVICLTQIRSVSMEEDGLFFVFIDGDEMDLTYEDESEEKLAHDFQALRIALSQLS